MNRIIVSLSSARRSRPLRPNVLALLCRRTAQREIDVAARAHSRRDGRTLTELESELEMTRFGVMKHLRVLENAGLIVTRRAGREKRHFLNPVPIRLIHDRWIDKYTERRVSALTALKHELEEAK
jgi:DNA-binding transcriptional ArsR family regulator